MTNATTDAMTDAESFLTRFQEFGAEPTPERYIDLFDPEATVFHPGMDEPLSGQGIELFIRGALAMTPDFGFKLGRSATTQDGGTVFAEAHNTATLAGEEHAWTSVYVVTLRGDRGLRGRAFYNRKPVYEKIDPSLARPPLFTPAGGWTMNGETDDFNDLLARDASKITAPTPEQAKAWVEGYAENWATRNVEGFGEYYFESGLLWNPGMPRPIRHGDFAPYYESILSLVADIEVEQKSWGHCGNAIYIEWLYKGSLMGRDFELPVVDRWLLDGDKAYLGEAYFDELAVWSHMDPNMKVGMPAPDLLAKNS